MLTTKQSLLHIAAQMEQLKRELSAISRPVSEGGSADISFPASHALGIAESYLVYGAKKLLEVAVSLSLEGK